MTTLITGVCGFIGFHLAKRLIHDGHKVIGVDNLNTYYDVNLKRDRLKILQDLNSAKEGTFEFVCINIEENNDLIRVFEDYRPSRCVNLAAQAGVRYSITNPSAYIQSNLVGFSNILECCRNFSIEHLLYASSSSVYGGNKQLPFSEVQSTDHPLSLYAATKKSNELMAHSYSNLYELPTTGLRFFTVYGPWGRPDMALFLFTKAMIEGKPIKLFNNGNMTRDFTYVDDIVESLVRLLTKPPTINEDFDYHSPDSSSSWAPYRIFNIGNSRPVPLRRYVDALEKALEIVPMIELLPMQAGDVPKNLSDSTKLEEWIGFRPSTEIDIGVSHFVEWYKSYYGN